MDDLGFVCLIALDEAVEILPSPLRHAFAYTAPRSAMTIEAADPAGAEQAFRITVDNQVIACAVFEGPLPEAEYEFAQRKSLFWKDAGVEMDGHRGFVALAADHREALHGMARAQAVAITRLAAALCEALPARGVYWKTADTLSPPEAIARAAGGIDRGKWPVDIWIGWQMYGEDDPEHPVLGLHTRGASAFLGFELEIPPFAVADRKEPLRILYGASGYLMNHGDVIRDGQQVEVIGERRTSYTLHVGADGNAAVARLNVIGTDMSMDPQVVH